MKLKWIHFNGKNTAPYYELFCGLQDTVFHPSDFQIITTHLEPIYSIATHKNRQAELLIFNEITQLLTYCIKMQKSNIKNDKLEVYEIIWNYTLPKILL